MAINIPTIDPDAAGQLLQAVTGTSQDPAVIAGTFLVVLARLIGFLAFAPFFGSMNIPMTARVALGVVLSLIISPFVQDTTAPALAQVGGALNLGFLLLLANQVLIGVMLGLVGAFIFYAIESAGRVIDTQRGSNITDIIAPQTGERTSPTGQWLMMLSLMLMVTTGMHTVILSSLIHTFEIFPPTTSLDWIGWRGSWDHSVVKKFADLSGASLLITLQIAAPAMISLMLTDVLLGIINRGAPQVNVFALSQVVKGPIGIAAILVAIVPIMAVISDRLIPGIATGSDSILNFARVMAGG